MVFEAGLVVFGGGEYYSEVLNSSVNSLTPLSGIRSFSFFFLLLIRNEMIESIVNEMIESK